MAAVSTTPGPGSHQSDDDSTTSGSGDSSATARTVSEACSSPPEDNKGWRLGNLDRYIYRILRAVNAIPACMLDEKEDTRPSEDIIQSGLQGCLKRIDACVDRNSAEWEAIQQAFTNYAKTKVEAERYQYFVKATNRILELLKEVTIDGCRAPSAGGKRPRFLVNDSVVQTYEYIGGTYRSKPDIVLAQEEFVLPLYVDPGEVDKAKKTLKTDEVYNTNGLEYLETAPSQPVAWDKNLMHLVFSPRSSVKLHLPAPWIPDLGATEDNTNYKETPKGNDNESEVPQEIVQAEKGSSAASNPSPQLESQTSQRSKGFRKRLAPVNASSDSDAPVSKKPRLSESMTVSASTTLKSASTAGSASTTESESDSPNAVSIRGYAEECLDKTFGRNHILGLFITDAKINICHFDHEYPMQMMGFDFLKNQHYLFLFLFALQRFDDKDWGFLPGFEKLIGKDTAELELQDSWVDSTSGEKRTFTGKMADTLYPRHSLGGRATGVLFGSLGSPLGKQDVVVKLSWPERVRDREKTFIDEAHKRLDAKNFPDHQPTEYLPDILAAQEYIEFESGPLRAAVLQDERLYERNKLGSRVPYLLVMPEYQPIATLTCDWDKFVVAFVALFYCHAMLWSVGIRHGDISENNLMWDPVTEKPKLCDFDLSHFCPPPEVDVEEVGPDGPMARINTGTWAFMAEDLLTCTAMDGCVQRVYRHEVEAFVAVLVWIAYRYEGGQLRDDPPFEGWFHKHYLHVKDRRSQSLRDISFGSIPQPSGLPEALRKAIASTVRAMAGHKRQLSLLECDIVTARFHEQYPQFRDYEPTPTISELPEDYNGLRALRMKILSWRIFTLLPSATPFVCLMDERILNASDKEQGKKI